MQVTTIQEAGKDDLNTASPNTCIVNATVLSIHDPDSTQKDSWCGKFPCTALLQINEIKNCGVGATGMIDLSTNLEANFTFTLASTDSVDKSIPIHLPGLKVGDKILTSLHLHPALNDRVVYTVYSYKLIAD
ncbi:hypothetical protein LBMAG27_04580 [Bacteroidota bacterium]|nr:hypothetical protein LBMAG27_04580 [Bacteroidota bacterium]